MSNLCLRHPPSPDRDVISQTSVVPCSDLWQHFPPQEPPTEAVLGYCSDTYEIFHTPFFFLFFLNTNCCNHFILTYVSIYATLSTGTTIVSIILASNYFVTFPIPRSSARTYHISVGGHSIAPKNHKRQLRKRQSVTAKREKSQTPKFV